MDWQIALGACKRPWIRLPKLSGHKGKAEMFFPQQHHRRIWEFLTDREEEDDLFGHL